MEGLADWGPEDVCAEIEYCDGVNVNRNGLWRRKVGGRRVERVEQVGMDEADGQERERERGRERGMGRKGVCSLVRGLFVDAVGVVRFQAENSKYGGARCYGRNVREAGTSMQPFQGCAWGGGRRGGERLVLMGEWKFQRRVHRCFKARE